MGRIRSHGIRCGYFCAARNPGFAIGVILLIIVLMAAILSSVAIAMRGSHVKSSEDQASIKAASILQTVNNMRNKMEYDIALSGSDWHQFFASTIPNTTVQEAYFGSLNDALRDATNAGVYQHISVAFGNFFTWHGTSDGNDYYAILFGVKPAVCRQFNRLSYGLSPDAAQPTFYEVISGVHQDIDCFCSFLNPTDGYMFCLLQAY